MTLVGVFSRVKLLGESLTPKRPRAVLALYSLGALAQEANAYEATTFTNSMSTQVRASYV